MRGAPMILSLRNSDRRYGIIAIFLHWLIAFIIGIQLWLGFFVGAQAPGSFARFEAMQWHKSVGLTILLLSVIRLIWHLVNPKPEADSALRPLEKRLAAVAHFGLYFLIIAVPLAGWATVSASPLGLPIHLYGLVPWPLLPFFDAAVDAQAMESLMETVHKSLIFLFLILALVHILAALRHQFLLKDRVLGRMIPWLNKALKTSEGK